MTQSQKVCSVCRIRQDITCFPAIVGIVRSNTCQSCVSVDKYRRCVECRKVKLSTDFGTKAGANSRVRSPKCKECVEKWQNNEQILDFSPPLDFSPGDSE